MDNIGLLAVDSSYPNLALMKISSYHKARGDTVDWYNPFDHYDKVYMAKVFGFTPDYRQYMTNCDQVEKGGTGYDITRNLPDDIDRTYPDYSCFSGKIRKFAVRRLHIGTASEWSSRE